MNLDAMINAACGAAADTRSQYHITLGELITKLRISAGDRTVSFGNGFCPTTPHSYRGYYSDLAFASTSRLITVAEFLDILEEANGTAYEGYKGGPNVMTDDTPLWNSEYGISSGSAIVRIEDAGRNGLYLQTKQID